MIISPLRYPGGKSKSVQFISQFIPNFDEYREPFLGGGSLFIYLKQKHPIKKFWINDKYENLYLFWKYLQINPSSVIQQIQEWKNNFQNGKELYQFLISNLNNFDEIKKASAFFIINRISFSGTSESGGYSEAAFVSRFNQSSIERLKKIPILLKENTMITNYDYKQLLYENGKNVFIFLDPPYYSATKSALYGKKGALHKSFNHEEFSEIMKNIKHKWLITYDNCDYIKNLFSYAYIKEWSLTYGMRNAGKKTNNSQGKELLISNLPITQQQQELSLFNEYSNI